MRVRSKKSAERRRGTADEKGSGKDLGNFTGFAHSRISAHFHAARTGYSTTTYDPIAAFLPSRLSRGYRKLRNTGFTRNTRSEITRGTEMEQVFIRSMTA
jgi:hypothetical protein